MSTNSRLNLISAKSLIGEFIFDFDIQNSDFINRLNRFISRGVELMDIDTYFKRCSKEIEAINNSAYLPCNAKYLELVIVNHNGNAYPIDIGNDFGAMNPLQTPTNGFITGYVEDNYIHFNEYAGKVLVVYRGIPVDKEGYCMLPDDSWLQEALLYFLIAKLSLSGFRHKVISREEAEAKWERLYPRARNSVNFPTVEEVGIFADMWTNPLFHNLHRLNITDYGSSNPNIGLRDAYPSNFNKLIKYEEVSDCIFEWTKIDW